MEIVLRNDNKEEIAVPFECLDREKTYIFKISVGNWSKNQTESYIKSFKQVMSSLGFGNAVYTAVMPDGQGEITAVDNNITIIDKTKIEEN